MAKVIRQGFPMYSGSSATLLKDLIDHFSVCNCCLEGVNVILFSISVVDTSTRLSLAAIDYIFGYLDIVNRAQGHYFGVF